MTQPAVSASARAHLRAATSDQHRSVENEFSKLNLRDRADYRAFLEAHAAAVAPLEAWADCQGAAHLLPDWPERKRLGALLADIRELDGETPLDPGGQLAMPPVDSGPAGLAGVLYVLEGARLGARVILNGLRTSPDPGLLRATRFLRHGAGCNFWASFLPVLESAIRNEAELRCASISANAAFSLFRRAARLALSKDTSPQLAYA